MLQERRVEHRAERAGETGHANVLGHAHAHWRVWGICGQLKMPPDGIFAGPILSGHLFADDRDILSIFVVRFGEGPAAQQRNSHRRKIIRGNRVVESSWRGLAWWRLVFLDGK